MSKNAWSISMLKDYEQCPRKYHEERVAKSVTKLYNAAGESGKDMHKAFELYLIDGTPIPATYVRHNTVLVRVRDAMLERNMEFAPECKLGVTILLTPCDFDDEVCWARGIADFVALGRHIALVLDWKTGRPHNDFDQLALMALLLFAKYPHIDEVRSGYYWTKETRLSTHVFMRHHWTGLWGDFVHRVERMRADTLFRPRQNFLCRGWCPVTKCAFNGRR